MFTLGIFLGSDAHFRNVKVPSSPYKRGREGTCKRTHNFWGLSSLSGDSLSPLASSLYLNVHTVLSLVFGDLIGIFGYPPTLDIVFLELHSTTQMLTTRTHTHPYEYTYANPTPMSTSEGLSNGRSGDSWSHQWRLVVDGNVAYHLTHNASKSWKIKEKVRAAGFEPRWVASHWTILPLDYKPNRSWLDRWPIIASSSSWPMRARAAMLCFMDRACVFACCLWHPLARQTRPSWNIAECGPGEDGRGRNVGAGKDGRGLIYTYRKMDNVQTFSPPNPI
jgi:hypothetical protein